MPEFEEQNPEGEQYIITEENDIPVPIGPPLEPVKSKIEVNGGDDLKDLFEPPDMENDADCKVDDLVESPEDEMEADNMEDLLTVSDEDVTGYPAEKKKPKLQRTMRRYVPPQGGMAGVGY